MPPRPARASSGRSGRKAIAVVAMTALALLSACKSATESSSSGASNTGAASDPKVKAAQEKTDKNKQEPTAIPLTTPLKEKPPTGKTFVWMKCDINQCKDIGDGIKDATAAVGWNYQELTYHSANPAELVSALKRALDLKPAAVGLSGLPEAVWQSVVPAYKAAGVPIIVNYLGPTPLDDTVLANIGGPVDVAAYGEIIGNWFIADSGGKGKALSIRTDDFPILKVFNDSFAKAVQDGCPGCSVTELKLTIPQVTGGKVNQAVVAALQKDSSLNYVITNNGPFVTGLTSALASAGLANKVRIGGESGDVSNLTNVQLGKEHAYTGLALHYGAWLQVDAAIRHLQGLSVPEGDGGLPKQLLVKGVDFKIANSYDKPTDFQDQLKKLWQVG